MEGDFQDEGDSIPSSAIMGGSEGSSIMSSVSMHGAFLDEGNSAMSWKQDTPPQVIYQANQTFAEFANSAKRPFAQAFAEPEQTQDAGAASGAEHEQTQGAGEASGLLHSRPLNSKNINGSSLLSNQRWQQQNRVQTRPHASYSKTVNGFSSLSTPLRQQQNRLQPRPHASYSNTVNGTSSLSTPLWRQQAPVQPRPHASYSNSTYVPTSLSNTLWQQQTHEQENPPSKRGYLSRVCGSISNLVVRVATHTINRASWNAVHCAVRWAASKNRHTEKTYIKVVKIADSAKRRFIGREPRVQQGDVQLERYRARVASQRRNAQAYRKSQQIATNWSQGIVGESTETPFEGFFMSGALMDTEEDTPSTPTRTQSMPGSWVESPVHDATTHWDNITPITVTPITQRDLNAYDHVYEVMDPERVEPSQATAASNAWPYLGNEHHKVELNAVDIDDGDSLMVLGDAQDEASFTDSTISTNTDSTNTNSTASDEISSTDSPSNTEDYSMLDNEPVEVEHVENEVVENESVPDEPNISDEDSYEVADSPPVPVIKSAPLDPLIYKYSWDNRSPDAVQRAAADEFNAILEHDDNTIMADDSMDHDDSNITAAGSPSTVHEAPIDIPTPMQSTELDKMAGSEASPSSNSVLANGTESPQGLGSSHHGSSSQVSDQGTPAQGAPSPSPVAHISSPPLNLVIGASPQKRVAFYESPKTGGPVNRTKNYVKGESMYYADTSATSDEDSSVLSELTSTPEIHSSPSYAEQLDRQLMVEHKDEQVVDSITPRSPEIAPVEAVPEIPVTPPKLPRGADRVKHGRVSQQRTKTRVAVNTRGSPMRLRSSTVLAKALTASSINAASVNVKKKSVTGKEKQNPSIESSIPEVRPTLAEGGLAHRISSQSNPAAILSPSTASANEELSPLAQDAASDAPLSSSLVSNDGKAMDASNFSVSEPYPSDQSLSLLSSPSNPLAITTQIPSAGDASLKDTLDNGVVDTPVKEAVSLSTQATSGEHTSVEDALATGTVDTPAKETVSPSTQAATSAVANTPHSSLAEGTLVQGTSSSHTENGSSTSNQVDASADVLSPATLARRFKEFDISDRKDTAVQSTKARKVSDRKAAREAKRLAEQRKKEKEEAEEKARKAKEAAEERKKRGTLRMPVQRVIQPLPAEWNNKVDTAMHESLLSKTMTRTLSATEITRRDLGKVLPQPGVPGEDARGWLNDTIISAYLELVVDHALKASGHKRNDLPKIVALSTYFYPKLKESAPANMERWLKRAKIEGKKMKDVERLFIPVNCNNNHWTLLVVSPKFKTIEYFDSMHGPSAEILRNGKELMKYCLGDEYVERDWKIVNVRGPTQLNGYDCGVFVSTTAKMISLGVDPMAFDGNDMPVQRRRIVAELLSMGFEGVLAPMVVFAADS